MPHLRRLLLLTSIGATAVWIPAAAAATTVRTARGCYRVGQRVHVSGRGFAADSAYDIAIDGVDFGQSTTDAHGGFATSLLPGGLPAGVAQSVDVLDASDGTVDAHTSFTVTRRTGALAQTKGAAAGHGRLEAWDFGRAAVLYLHDVQRGRSDRTVRLGRAGGQCGFLHTGELALLPNGATGDWTLQLDTDQAFTAHPRGPMTRVTVQAG